ncbi:MAG: glutamate mutase L, partial [Deltaproteobacteria bacterium]|nr:glutamate mutase L [Deltaproteobacteria bacterium]
TAVDADRVAVVGTAAAFTTIATDVMDGFNAALAELRAQIGEFHYDQLLCCSSAGGGLKMAALGLVPELTAKAAKMAAESAGAKVMRTYAYEISVAEQDAIRAVKPDIVLLCGGTDGGNRDVIIKNAGLLCEVEGDFPVIVAGNKSAARELEAIFKASGKQYVITKNVMPVFGRLDIEPARSAIRDIFIDRIIDAKGLAGVQALTERPIIPTPLAVLQGCELLSRGTRHIPGLGEFLAVDPGGATTDVYSLAAGTPTQGGIVLKGLPEPYAKRTVEGDLGMRRSAGFLLEEAGPEAVAQACGLDPATVRAWVGQCAANPEILAPAGSPERRIDEALAGCAIAIAVERHCGVMEQTYTPLGEMFTLTGKDLSAVPHVVGTGGVLCNSENPLAVLRHAAGAAKRTGRMLPRSPGFMLDERYILSAMGLIGAVDPDLALTIMRRELRVLDPASL